MRNPLLLAALGSLTVGPLGCAESALQQDLERDSEVDFLGAELDAGVVAPPVDPNERPLGRIDAGQARDAGGPETGVGPTSDAGDSAATSPRDGGDQADGAARDAGAVAPDVVQPSPDAGQPVVDSGAAGCASGTQMCSSQCIDTTTSSQNCGACGTACNNGSTCVDSKCTAPITVPSGCTARVFEGRTYAFCTTGRSWGDARRSCLDAKMDLALVTSVGESDFVQGNGNSWIAANDLQQEGTWVSPTLGDAGSNSGPALSFMRWTQGEPSNTQRCGGLDVYVSCLGRRSDEDCGMIRGSDGLWNDDDCDRNYRYVCEPF